MFHPIRSLHAGLFLAAIVSSAWAAPIVVQTPEALQEAVAKAQPGDEIAIAAGTHDGWRAALSGKGAEGKPIVIRPEKPGETILTGATGFALKGSHIEIRNLLFRDCRMDKSDIVALNDATHCRITDCRFEKTRGKNIVISFRGHSNDNRVDHCTLVHTVGRPLTIFVSDRHLPQRNRIDHNLFEDVPPKGGNGRETIQIGQNQPAYGLLEPQTVVEYNIFRRCDGESEIISNKSSRNVYRGNVFDKCRGALVMRGGSYGLIEGNWFDGCSGGVRLHGTHHRVVGNTILNSQHSGVTLPYGMQRPLGSLYQATGNCLIANNTIVDAKDAGIYLGQNRDRDLLYSSSGKKRKWNYEKHGDITTLAEAPYDNRILNNIISATTGTLILVKGSPENTIADNLLYNSTKATLGTPGKDAVEGDPMFTDPAAGDYSPRPDSPARKTKPVPVAGIDQPAHLGATGKRPEAGPEYGQ